MSSTAAYNFVDPLAAQGNFERNFNTENPAEAASSYARLMHEHTKKQLQSFTEHERRRSSIGSGPISLTTEPSNSSLESAAMPE